MPSLDKYNQVEAGLKAAVERVPGLAGKTFVGHYGDPGVFPRAEIYVETVDAEERVVGGRSLDHVWGFLIEVVVVSGNEREGYEEVKRLFWGIYDEIMRDRTLGVEGAWALPAVSSRLEREIPEEGRYGFVWSMRVNVYVSEV